MKGNPLRYGGLVVVMIAAGALIWLLCRPSLHENHALPEDGHPLPSISQSAGAQGAIRPATLRATLLLHATPAPLHCSIRQQGILLLSERDKISPGEYRAAVDLAKGVDLVVAAEWPNDEPHSVRVEVLVHGYQATLEKSFWAERTLEETFPTPASFLP